MTSEPQAELADLAGGMKELLLAVAAEEFADVGFAEASLDRISERAGVSQETVQSHFGHREGLFDAVIWHQIGVVVGALPLTAAQLTSYAAARFDYVLLKRQVRDPVRWRAIEQAEATLIGGENFAGKVDSIAAGQRAGSINVDIGAVDLLAMVLALTESWLGAPQSLHGVVEGSAFGANRLTEHRS